MDILEIIAVVCKVIYFLAFLDLLLDFRDPLLDFLDLLRDFLAPTAGWRCAVADPLDLLRLRDLRAPPDLWPDLWDGL